MTEAVMHRSDPSEPHTSTVVEQSIAGLRLHVTEMGGLVIEQVASAVRALLDRDASLARVVLARESMVDDYERRLDSDSLTFMALQQPVANDLRLARAIVRMSRELERAGDEAKKIARFALSLQKVTPGDPVAGVARHLRHMAALSGSMLRGAVRAADELDAAAARETLKLDPELDAEFAASLRQIMSYVLQDQRLLKPTIDTIFALKGLERIGDHAVNIAEQVLYMLGESAPQEDGLA
ncbi:MAG: phosphate signaling complex protein PhoU [Steroidobacteraceae bacterium]